MILCGVFTLISLWYVYKTSYTCIPKQSIYAFVLMVLYGIVYFTTPYINDYAPVQRYTYIFSTFPLIMYYIILFPHSVLIPTKAFFPKLSDHLAVDATIIMAWVGFLSMFILLLGLSFFYKNSI